MTDGYGPPVILKTPEEIQQARRITREGLIRWVKSLRDEMPIDTRVFIAAAEVMVGDLPSAIRRVLDVCTDVDIVDMLALCTGAHQYGELIAHIRSVRFIETDEERKTREHRQRLRAWYSDPVRDLPRKVVADVLELLDALK